MKLLLKILSLTRNKSLSAYGLVLRLSGQQPPYCGISTSVVKSAGEREASSNWGSKKSNRNVKLNYFNEALDPRSEAILEPLRRAVKEQVS